jgi:hypothetical protein
VIPSIWAPAAHLSCRVERLRSIWRSEGDLLPCRVGADNREESGGERDDHRRVELRKGITGATAAAMLCLAGGIAGLRGLWQERHAWEGDRGGCGREADAAGTSAGGTRDAAGALDAGWTLWMRQNVHHGWL